MYCCHRRRQHRGVRTTRLHRTLSRRSLSALPASTAPRPTFVTIMIRPSERDGMATDMPLFRPSGKAEIFFISGLDTILTIRSDLPVGSNCRAYSLHIVIASAAKQSTHPRGAVWIASSQELLAMTARYTVRPHNT